MGWAMTPFPEAGWGDVGVAVASVALPSGRSDVEQKAEESHRFYSTLTKSTEVENHNLNLKYMKNVIHDLPIAALVKV